MNVSIRTKCEEQFPILTPVFSEAQRTMKLPPSRFDLRLTVLHTPAKIKRLENDDGVDDNLLMLQVFAAGALPEVA